MATVGLYTLGCKVSQYETEAIREAFEKQGYVARPFEEECDVYVINTCTVTAESDRKSRQIIRRAIGRNPDAVVLVTGCYSQTSPEAVAATSRPRTTKTMILWPPCGPSSTPPSPCPTPFQEAGQAAAS